MVTPSFSDSRLVSLFHGFTLTCKFCTSINSRYVLFMTFSSDDCFCVTKYMKRFEA